MKIALLIVAALLVVFGTVFFFQGIGVLVGGAMVGDRKWAVIGPILAVIGVVLGICAVRRSARSSSKAWTMRAWLHQT
jgi:hypothetical protein